MNQEKKKSRKRILVYYLILAACILVIAAITVGVIFAVNNGTKSGNLTLDNENDQTDQTDEGEGDENNGDDDVQDTSSKYVFITPLAEIDLLTSHTFCQHPLGHWAFHTGIDLAAEEGTDVYACLDGTVESIVTNLLDGTVITLSHENGIKTVYSLVDAVESLNVGDEVARGQVIATVASATGLEYKLGSHLHFEVFANGESVDPEDYLDLGEK